MPVSVDIVLPCYNPGSEWHQELLAFHEHLRGDYQVQYIVVNDGSSNPNVQTGIDQITKENVPATLISYEENKGKGYALRQGVKASTADLILYTDIDFPFTNQSVIAVLNTLVQTNADIVAGYRSDAYYQKKMTGFRVLLSKSFRFFLRSVVKLPVTDTQCGLKGFNQKGKSTFLSTQINRYLFDFEFIYKSCKNPNLTLSTVEVSLKDNVVFRSMKLKILMQETLNLFRILLFKRN